MSPRHARASTQLRPWQRVLGLLESNGGAPMSAGSVGAALGISAGSARIMLDGLVSRKLADRVKRDGVVKYRRRTEVRTHDQ